jgi:hypothetical protein
MRYKGALSVVVQTLLLTGCGVLSVNSGSKSANAYIGSLVFETEADLSGFVCDSSKHLFSSESAARDEVKNLLKGHGMTGKVSLSFSRGSSALAYFDLWSSGVKLQGRLPIEKGRPCPEEGQLLGTLTISS